MRYDNPSERFCLRFDTCHDWAPSTWVSWWEVPTHQVGIFFETIDCKFRDDKYNFKTTRGHVDGWKTFEQAKSFRSFMFGDYEDALLELNLTEASSTQTCNIAKARATFEGLDVNGTLTNATSNIEWSSAGDLSSNWTDPLPAE
ncbi:NEDD8-specific protease 1 [Phytophthora cinnamomi]|uniref:NEDD8-specific protease 1 n=1 Tax=Phytophthora cinnamomi TaxID=4785 RepID=UPI0035595ADD|nr:NEDD8-specific protease 1 [Phytophthora cinnamomi]